MATVTDIVLRAHRKAGVASHDEELTAEQTVNGIDALNAMLHGWRLNGVDLSWEDAKGGDDFALASEYHEGVCYLLASRLFPDYSLPPSFNPDDWFRAIQANNVTAPTMSVPADLLNMPSQFYRGSRNRGRGR